MLRLFLALWLAITPSFAWAGSIPLMGAGKPAAGAVTPTFTYDGTDQYSGTGGAFTSTAINIGAATSDRFIIVALADQNGVTLSGVTVNGVALAEDVNNGAGNHIHIYSGLVGATGGAGAGTIIASYDPSASFTGRVIMVWTGTGMASTAGAKHTAAATANLTSISINVSAGDFLVAADPFGGVTYTTSTETPTATHTNSVVDPPTLIAAEWNTIASTNAAFAVNINAATVYAAASYR